MLLVEFAAGLGPARAAAGLAGLDVVCYALMEPARGLRRAVRFAWDVSYEVPECQEVSPALVAQWQNEIGGQVDVVVVAGHLGRAEEYFGRRHVFIELLLLLEDAFPGQVKYLATAFDQEVLDPLARCKDQQPGAAPPRRLVISMDQAAPIEQTYFVVTNLEAGVGEDVQVRDGAFPGGWREVRLVSDAPYLGDVLESGSGPLPPSRRRAVADPLAQQVWQGDYSRALESCEWERLLGFRPGHSYEVIPKRCSREERLGREATRVLALARSPHVVGLARLLGSLGSRRAHGQAAWSTAEIWALLVRQERGTELVPDAPEDAEDAFASQAGELRDEAPVGWTAEHHAVYSHMRLADTKGSDLRLSPGQAFRPRAWPRHSFAAKDWVWRTIQSYDYRVREHINILEERSYLNYLRRRSLQVGRHRMRFLHVFDSQAATAVSVKGR